MSSVKIFKVIGQRTVVRVVEKGEGAGVQEEGLFSLRLFFVNIFLILYIASKKDNC